ncbi:MAG TPA: TonB-dependent receptor [Terracidiphilus sp.]|jgi:hypothetical protein|nr:TonB-dependent receptor [Terracidiphilus sp.]
MARSTAFSRRISIQTQARFVALALLALLLGSGVAKAQVLYGTIAGTVTDQTGALVPNAPITLANEGTGESRSTTANDVGTFTFLDVLPGTYTVSVHPKGNFASYTEKGIQVEINRQVRVDIALQPGSVTTQITVTEALAELQTESAEVNSEISQSQISALPMTSSQGRSYQALYTIIPGAASVQEKNSTASNPSRSMSVNVNGASYNGNTTRIDGAVNYYGWLPYLIAYVPPADSIENVSFTTNAFNAEQGQAGGASIKITTKSGTKDFHGSAWWYYQDGSINAKSYTTPSTSAVPKNIFDQFGFNIGGPVYIPKILTGKKKLFFFENFERTTRRQLISGDLTVPDTNMIGGNFSEAAPYATLYDPQPVVPAGQWMGTINSALCPTLAYTNGYLNYSCRPSFTNEYGETGRNVNAIPASRIASAAATMIANLQPIAAQVGAAGQPAASFSSVLANDIFGTGTLAYNRNTSDSKITYIPSEKTQIFGKYSIEPFSLDDPQELQNAGGGTFDGGQPGASKGRIQNVGLGMSHILTSTLVVDADFGYTRQVTGAQSDVDVKVGDYGTNQLGIPGTNGPGANYVGQPAFDFISGTFNGLGNTNGSNPFLFRDNQFTGDVNLSWVKSKHSMKYGFTYYHFDLNHFQPTSGSGINVPRGGFMFGGGMTCGITPAATKSTCGVDGYNSLADFLLGLPNNGTGSGVAKPSQVFNPNSLRWTELGFFAQDQWSVTPRLTINYGIRYERYPAPYRDRTGVSVLVPTLPQSANVEVGGVGGNPEDAGIKVGWGMIVPRIGFDFRLNEKTVLRTGFGITTDPDSMRYLRDAFPEDLAPVYVGTGTGTIAVDPANTTNYTSGQPMTLTYGIPAPAIPNYSTGFASLPVSGSTNTVAQNFRRGYIESWNLFIQRDLGYQWNANVGYVGNRFVRQPVGVGYLNAAPFPSASTPCMANGQYNPSTGLKGGCSFNDNETINQQFCTGTSNLACYNTGGITMNLPLWDSYYDALQSQLTRNAGKNASLGVVYTYSHAIDFEDNGAGSGSQGTVFNYPGFYYLNRGTAGYDQKHNLQVWGIYSLPFGYGQRYANHGILAEVVGGFQLNGQFSHYSGTPFSVSANSNLIGNLAPGFGSTYAQLVAPYKQLSGHNRVFGNTSVSGGKAWFDPSVFANPNEPTASVAGNPNNAPPILPNTGRNDFRGPGQSIFNTSLFRAFHIYRETEFQIRIEAFNVLNHAWLTNPNTTVPSNANIASGNYGTFGLITSYGPPYSPTAGARSLQFSGRFNF